MPKEGTYGVQHTPAPFTIDVESGQVVPNEMPPPSVPVVDVMWNREGGYVQIVTKLEDPHGGRFASDFEGVHYTDGMHIDLDRDGINRLIRNLRRARDQAFGRDE